jgi:MFS family permease
MELPRIRARFTRDALVAGASVLHALAALVLGYSQSLALLIVATLATGVAWISILSAVQVSSQTTLPPWGRARGLAAFIVTLMGGMAFGSILWGQVASRIGHPVRAHRGRGWHGDRDCADVAIRARSTRRAGLHPNDGLACPGARRETEIALLVAPARDSGLARVSFVTSKPLAVIVSCNGAF